MIPKARTGLLAHVLQLVVLAAAASAVGCASTRIAIAEAFGYEKREQLVGRVEAARDAQQAAKEQFASALDEFLAVVGSPPGNLEAHYETLREQLEASESRAEAVRDRIGAVENVAIALFEEWEAELDNYSSASLRTKSAAQLADTRARYAKLINAMHEAAAKMDPVLAAFNDQVLFIKHNLNAQAIASLQLEADSLEADIRKLIAEMEASIAQANAFIDDMAAP